MVLAQVRVEFLVVQIMCIPTIAEPGLIAAEIATTRVKHPVAIDYRVYLAFE